MKRRRKKILTICSILLLCTSTLTTVSMAFATTVNEPEEVDQASELPLPYDHLLDAPTVEAPEVEEAEPIEEEPFFSFKQEKMAGTVGEEVSVVIMVDRHISQVQVTIPSELTVDLEKLSEEIEAIQLTDKTWWFKAEERNEFTIPIFSETTGQFTISIEDKVEGSLVIDEQLELEESESIVVEDSDDSEIQDDNGSHIYESEEVIPTTTTNVSTWAQYRTAINNQNVTVINVTANISGNTSLNNINRNLTINGNGFTINSQGQQHNITGANRQITVRNATITGTLSGSSAQYRSTTGASNTRFTFSDITFRGANRFVGPADTVNNIVQTVIFDGGSSYLAGSGDTLITNATNLRLINGASVDVIGRRFAGNITGTSSERINAYTVFIEEGSSLSVTDVTDSIFTGYALNIDGYLKANALGAAAVSAGSMRTQPVQIDIGKTANVVLERSTDQGPIFNLDRENVLGNSGAILIAKESKFDFINRGGGPVIAGTRIRSTIVNLESGGLALWDRGLQNEEKASMIFSDVTLQLAGVNGSEIISSNNERFQRLYDPTGLASYSRISNLDVEEMDRYVTVDYETEEGTTLEISETLTGFLGDSYQSTEKEIPGYQLIALPENATGEFTRETTQVTYVYQRDSVSPVDPLDPETEVDPENKPEIPENQGLLSIDFASQFQFGTQAISSKEKTYYAQPQRLLNPDGTVNVEEERPNYIQISDRRNDNERNGWQLAVTQATQFSTETGKMLNQASLQLMNQQLVSAQNGEAPSLMMTNPLTLIPGNKRTLLRAEGTEGQGTWIYRFGDAESARESVALNIPQGAAPDAETYTTRLLWELSIVPGSDLD